MSDDFESLLVLLKDIRIIKYMIWGDWMQVGNYIGYVVGYKFCFVCGFLFFQFFIKFVGELMVMIVVLMVVGILNVVVNQIKIMFILLCFKRSVIF